MSCAFSLRRAATIINARLFVRRDTPIDDRRGQVTGAVMVFHDVGTTRALSLRMFHLAQHDGLTVYPTEAC